MNETNTRAILIEQVVQVVGNVRLSGLGINYTTDHDIIYCTITTDLANTVSVTIIGKGGKTGDGLYNSFYYNRTVP